MWRSSRVSGPLGCLASLLVAGGAPARDEDLFIRPSEQYSVLFAGFDGGRSTFVSGGAKQTLTGPLDRDGVVTMETSGYGLTRERFRADWINLPATRFVQQNAALVGYQWSWPGVFLSALAGPETQFEQITIARQVLRWSQPRFGLRSQFELWSNPTPDTLLTGTIVAGTTRTSLWACGSAGIRLLGPAFVGPEITVYATPTYTETRFGLHVTGPKLGIAEFRVSTGWMSDDGHRRGSPYLGVTAWMRL